MSADIFGRIRVTASERRRIIRLAETHTLTEVAEIIGRTKQTLFPWAAREGVNFATKARFIPAESCRSMGPDEIETLKALAEITPAISMREAARRMGKPTSTVREAARRHELWKGHTRQAGQKAFFVINPDAAARFAKAASDSYRLNEATRRQRQAQLGARLRKEMAKHAEG